jgi:hypothetical protein
MLPYNDQFPYRVLFFRYGEREIFLHDTATEKAAQEYLQTGEEYGVLVPVGIYDIYHNMFYRWAKGVQKERIITALDIEYLIMIDV